MAAPCSIVTLGRPLAPSVTHYENFPVASLLCPPLLRQPIAAIYAFARAADDLADEGDATADERLADLSAYRAELHAVTTWHLPASYDWDGAIDSIDWSGGARRTLESAISDALSEEDAARVVRHLVEGHPARMLVRQAADADLLVIGSRGHGGLAGILVGSVGLHLLAHATCPVVVVHGDRVPSAPTVASRSTQFAHN